MSTDLFLTFPDKETSLVVARALSGNEEVERLPLDGWLETEHGRFYYVIDDNNDMGITITDESGEPVPGYHVNGRWMGPDEMVPDALNQFRTYPETPQRVFG